MVLSLQNDSLLDGVEFDFSFANIAISKSLLEETVLGPKTYSAST